MLCQRGVVERRLLSYASGNPILTANVGTRQSAFRAQTAGSTLEHLEIRLTVAVMRHRPLRFREHVVRGGAVFPDLAGPRDGDRPDMNTLQAQPFVIDNLPQAF